MRGKPEILFGPPGTGKTTELIRIVEDFIENGIAPDQVAFIAFTRKAAKEAMERACHKFSLSPDQLPWFRTLHSLAFNQLGLNRNNVMGIRDYLTLCEMLGLNITTKGISYEDGTFSGLTKGDRLFFMENMARAKLMTLKEYWESVPMEDIYWYELERLHKTLVEYKQIHGKQDFTDIITAFCEGTAPCPPCRVLVVDEAQDLSALQWRMVDRIASAVEWVFIAGDDDQAIFRWAGAHTEHIIELDGNRRVLEQSYRVPAEVQRVAESVASRISVRVPKSWRPREGEGFVQYETALEHVDMSQGTWLLLARNAYLLDSYVQHCLTEGYVFDSATGSPLRGDAFRAIRAYEAIRSGDRIPAGQAKVFYEFMSTRVGVAYGFKGKFNEVPDRDMVDWQSLHDKWGLVTKKPWHEALDKLTPQEAEYFMAALRRGEKLLAEPRIKISTIHGAKGGEAENVVIQLDMADRSWREYQENPDDEHRVWYVAVTRAKQRLIVLSPQTNRAYEL